MSDGPWGWVDARIKHQGWLSVLTTDAVAVYSFLCLAADKHGVSFYRRDRMSRELGLDDQDLWRALQRLIALGLIGYQPFSDHAPDGFHQVLRMPSGSPPSPF